MLDEELWHRSGHWDNYRENMFFVEPSEREGDQRRYALKPMNCPGACLVFGSVRHSYRELPLRLAEFGDSRVTSARASCTGSCGCARSPRTTPTSTARSSRSRTRSTRSARAIDELYARFGFDDVRVELSTRPEKSIGTDEQWERATSGLREALERQGREYEVSPGEGTFYGPKIDFHVTDALGRSWQLGTCQLDFQMPERFGLTYQGEDNAEHTPVMIHRALLGSMERFAGILIEHYGGRFPAWLAPVQAAVLPVADPQLDYAREVAGELEAAGLRVRVDDRTRVRRAQDPRRRAGEAAVHADRRRARAGGRDRVGALARPRRPGPRRPRRDPCAGRSGMRV